MARNGTPEIFTTDQGSQLTSAAFTGLLTDLGSLIAMDGKSFWRDSAFIERLRRWIKHEEVCLHAYDSASQARSGIGRYIEYYYSRRSLSSLQARAPDEVYFISHTATLATWRAISTRRIDLAPGIRTP